MPQIQPFRFIFDRELADGSTQQINPATVDVQEADLVQFVDPEAPEATYLTAPLSGPGSFFNLSDDDIRYATVRPTSDVDVIDLNGDTLDDIVALHLAASNIRTNNTVPLCSPWHDEIISGQPVRIHEPAIVIGPATAAEFAAVPVAAYIDVAFVPVGLRSGRGAFQVGAFISPNDAGVISFTEQADRLRRAVQAGATFVELLNPANQAQPWRINEATLATIDPRGRVFVAPADLGAGLGQIDPTTPIGNTATVFEQHPTVFIRRGANVRAVGAVENFRQGWGDPATGDGYQINEYRGAPAIYVCATRPEGSIWRLYFDGAPVDVSVPHGPTLDLRRPRDVWNTIIAPLVSDGAPFGTPAPFGQGFINNDRPGLVSDAGTLSLLVNTTRYLQAARCLGFYGPGDRGVPLEFVPQVPFSEPPA